MAHRHGKRGVTALLISLGASELRVRWCQRQHSWQDRARREEIFHLLSTMRALRCQLLEEFSSSTLDRWTTNLRDLFKNRDGLAP